MPYIRNKYRTLLNRDLNNLLSKIGSIIEFDKDIDGIVNYIITLILLNFYCKTNSSYHSFVRVLGILESVKHEFYRRIISKYEDEKIKTEGDVYD